MGFLSLRRTLRCIGRCCAEAAVYFPKFDPRLLADVLVNLASSPETARRMAADGVKRSLQFCGRGMETSICKSLQRTARSLGGIEQGASERHRSSQQMAAADDKVFLN